MRTVFTVFCKEVLDSLRDRRTLISALLMGPLFGPLIFVFMINLSLERSMSDVEKTLDVPALGAAHAPNLVAYLESNNLRLVDLPDSREAALEAVEQGLQEFVLVIPEDFGERLRGSLPARVEIISDRANTSAERDARRLRDALERYNSELATLRLAARGISPLIAKTAQHRRCGRLDAVRQVRSVARHDELFLHLRIAARRHVPRHRLDGRRT